MVKTIQRIGVLCLLVVFLFGTTGISVFEHICTCKGITEITLFPEIFDYQSSCCCSGDEAELVSVDHASLCGLENADHCKNIKFFIKANIAPAPVILNVLSFIDYASTDYPLPANISLVTDIPANEHAFCDCASPPITGRQRVIAFHQSKIPAPHISLV